MFLADGSFFDGPSVNAIAQFYSSIPSHLMAGVLAPSPTVPYDAPYLGRTTPFATATASGAFSCPTPPDDLIIARILVATPRSFNIYPAQLGERSENAFKGTSEFYLGDLMLTVLRHETSHQFDRLLTTRELGLKENIRSRCTVDDNWLRAGVAAPPQGSGANAFFQANAVEILASQVGNQYFVCRADRPPSTEVRGDAAESRAGRREAGRRGSPPEGDESPGPRQSPGDVRRRYLLSSSTQLGVARERADVHADLLPFEWYLFNVGLVGDETSTTFFERASLGIVETFDVGLDRTTTGGPVSQLRVPGCGTYDFSYDAATGHLSSYTYARPSGGELWDVLRERTPFRRFEAATAEVRRTERNPPARYAPGFGLGPGDACVPNDAGTPFPTREPTLDPTASPSAPPATFPANRSCGVIVMKGNDQNTVECETTPTEGPRPRRLSYRRGRKSRPRLSTPRVVAGYAFTCCDDSNACTRFHPVGTVGDETDTGPPYARPSGTRRDDVRLG